MYRTTSRGIAGVLAMGVIAVSAACASPVSASSDEQPAGWVDRNAVSLSTTAADGPLDELEPLQEIVGDGVVVGLGESAHGTHDEFTLRHRMARFLVERMGFRTLSWEEDWGSGVAIDRYVVDGVGDPREIVASSIAAWRSEEMLELVEWMRSYNLSHQDKVRFLGTDVTHMRQLSIDEISRFVEQVAPDRLEALRTHLDPIALRGTPMRHVGWYLQQPDKQPLIEHARAVLDLVSGLPTGGSTLDREIAVQNAKAVLGFYEYYTRADPDYRDRVMADTLRWWQERTGHKVVYWAANVHVAANPRVDYSFPPHVQSAQLVPAGHNLRRQYGEGYVAIAAVFGSGEVLQGWETGSPSVYQVPVPRADTVDHTLAQASAANYLLNLHAPATPQVQEWLAGPVTMRLIGAAYDPSIDSEYAMHIDSWTAGFDAVAYLRTTDPAQVLR
jgi:erythromycin esterase